MYCQFSERGQGSLASVRSVHKAGCQVYRERGREVWRGAGVETTEGEGWALGGTRGSLQKKGLGSPGPNTLSLWSIEP